MTQERIVIHIDDEDILELAPGYLDSRRNELTTLQHALSTGDFETLRNLGHKMKGSGGGFGFERLTEIGSNLESYAKEHESTAIQRELADLQDYLNRVEIVG